MGPVKEDLLTRLLPYVLKGLKSRNHDYRASSYMIASLMGSKVVMETKVVVTLLEYIMKVGVVNCTYRQSTGEPLY